MIIAFANAGADVVIASRKLDNCQALAEQIEATGRRALPVACHVGHWDECDELVDRAYEHFGTVDILVNNAGMSPLAPSSAETSQERFDKVIGVNFKGPFRLSSLIGQRMYDSGGGSIINISSSGALFPSPRFGPYAGAKAALNALTMVFALEFGPRVRVNAISAGPVPDRHRRPLAGQRDPGLGERGRPGRASSGNRHRRALPCLAGVELYLGLTDPGRRRDALSPAGTRTCC
jgi:NAD(P)-dependent dehydrogenase (short-subunit alcohol dehydrogenase family)